VCILKRRLSPKGPDADSSNMIRHRTSWQVIAGNEQKPISKWRCSIRQPGLRMKHSSGIAVGMSPSESATVILNGVSCSRRSVVIREVWRRSRVSRRRCPAIRSGLVLAATVAFAKALVPHLSESCNDARMPPPICGGPCRQNTLRGTARALASFETATWIGTPIPMDRHKSAAPARASAT